MPFCFILKIITPGNPLPEALDHLVGIAVDGGIPCENFEF